MSRAQKKKETVFPNEVIDAIKYARKKNPSDRHGDGAFKLGYNNIRNGNNGTRWMSLYILKKQPTGKWEHVPLLLRNINLRTTARIKTEEEKKEAKQDYPGIYLNFNADSTYVRNLRKGHKVVGEVVEQYGKAKCLIAKAFNRLAKAALKSGEFFQENQSVKLNVQFSRWTNKAKGQKENLEQPICRVKVPFEGDNKNLTVPRIPIYDVEKKDASKKNAFPYELATWEDEPLDYHTIRKFIRCGSNASFIEDLSGVCLSSQGMSNPSKVKDFLMIKKGKGRRMDAEDVFDVDDFADIDGGTTVFVDEDDSSETPETPEEAMEKIEAAEEQEFDDFADALNAEEDDELPGSGSPSDNASGEDLGDGSGEDLDDIGSDDLDELDDDL